MHHRKSTSLVDTCYSVRSIYKLSHRFEKNIRPNSSCVRKLLFVKRSHFTLWLKLNRNQFTLCHTFLDYMGTQLIFPLGIWKRMMHSNQFSSSSKHFLPVITSLHMSHFKHAIQLVCLLEGLSVVTFTCLISSIHLTLFPLDIWKRSLCTCHFQLTYKIQIVKLDSKMDFSLV